MADRRRSISFRPPRKSGCSSRAIIRCGGSIWTCPIPSNPKPSWYGESVGHYEGDTLVVDTIGQKTQTVVDPYRTPHTEKLHVVERWTMTEGGKGLEVNFKVDDPDTFNQPWSGESGVTGACSEQWSKTSAPRTTMHFDYHIPVADKPDF